MKQAVSIAIVVILLLGIFHMSTGSGSEIKFIKKNGYIEIDINLPKIMVSGYPMLPYEVKTYVFPAGTKIKEINVRVDGTKTIKINGKIAPAPQPVAGDEGAHMAKEGSVYAKDEFYPEKWYDYSMGMGLKDGRHVLFLNIYLYKFRYNAVKNEIKYATNFDVSVDYSTAKPLFTASNYDLLIIAPSDWLSDLQPLVQHKESHGIRTKLVSIEEAKANARKGKDDAEKIKYYIKDEIEKDGIKYVMLVGSATIFPVRYSHAYDKEETSFVSDLYYADIYDANGDFSSWDSNGDGIYGEFDYQGKTDDVDLYPDVYVGRIACSSRSELDTVVNKIIEYENNVYGNDWTHRISVCGGDSHNDNEGVYEGERIKDSAIFTLQSKYEITKLYASAGDVSRNSIMNEFNKGELLFNFAGHGNRISWATHPPKNFNAWIGFDISDVYMLKNGNKLPIVVLNACDTGQFDKGLCLAWGMVGVAGKGAIASMAATALSWEYVGSYCDKGLSGYLDVRICRNFDMGKLLGDVFYDAKIDYIRWQHPSDAYNYKVLEEWELFGDPTLLIGGYGNTTKAIVSISNPQDGYLYIGGKQIMPTLFGRTIIIGKIDVMVKAYNVNRVEFYFDDELKYTAQEPPYEWELDERAFFAHEIKVIGYGEDNKAEDTKSVIIFNI